MRRLLILIALVAGTMFPAAGAFGSLVTTARTDHTGIGIRLVAPVATRDNPRARVYIIDHVKPGTTVDVRIEVSNDTGQPTEVAVYPAAAAIDKGFLRRSRGGHTQRALHLDLGQHPLASGWPTGPSRWWTSRIDVPSDAAPGEQYAVLWAQTTSAGSGAVTQVSRVGIRVYLSVGPGGEPASSFEIESFTAERDAAGTPVVAATIHNTGGRALDLRGRLTLSDGPGGLSAGPFPVTLGTTLGLRQTEPVTVRLDPRLPSGPWKAHLEVTSGLLTETAQATLTFRRQERARPWPSPTAPAHGGGSAEGSSSSFCSPSSCCSWPAGSVPQGRRRHAPRRRAGRPARVSP